MFGGLAFLVGANRAVAASGQGGLLVHVEPEQSEVPESATSAVIARSPTSTARAPSRGTDDTAAVVRNAP